MSVVPEEVSRRIVALRFLLIVLVVFIHNNYTAETVAEYTATGRTLIFNQGEFGRWVQLFFSDGIARCAVPLLFLFSAYLQGLKEEPFKVTLQKKFRSLFLPYVIWIGAYGLYYTVGKWLVAQWMPGLLGNPADVFTIWSGSDWLHKILGYGPEHDGLPGFAYHLWFMRDLMILVVLTPALKFLARNLSGGFFAAVCVWYILSPPVPGVSSQAVFFYVAGLYWGMFRIPLLAVLDSVSWKEAAALFLALFFSTYVFSVQGESLYWLMVLAACLVLLKFSRLLCRHERTFSVVARLSGYAFFLYAVHTPVLNVVLKKVWLHFFPMTNTFFSLFGYFGVTVLTVVAGTGAGVLAKRLCPEFYSVLTGGR